MQQAATSSLSNQKSSNEANSSGAMKDKKTLESLFRDGVTPPPLQNRRSDHENSVSKWGKESVANLDAYQVTAMPSELLSRIVRRWAEYLPRPDVKHRLQYLDRSTLEQLVYLVREICRRMKP